jgi:HipA-like protein
MRKGKVFNNKILAGIIIELKQNEFEFSYEESYLADDNLPAISLHFPKQKMAFKSDILFPFFYNLLSEGAIKKLQSLTLKIDETDAFGFLLKTAAHETIGAIRVEEIEK